MGLPVGEVQTAIITRLRADATLQGLLVGSVTPRWSIFDATGVPTLYPFPYIVVNEVAGSLGTLLVMGTDAVDLRAQIAVYDQNTGFDRARSIVKQVHADLEWQPLTLANGFTNVYLATEMYQEVSQSDGLTEQVVERFKLMVSG